MSYEFLSDPDGCEEKAYKYYKAISKKEQCKLFFFLTSYKKYAIIILCGRIVILRGDIVEEVTSWFVGLLLGSLVPGILMFIIQKKLTNVSKSLEDKKTDEKRFNVIIIKSLICLGENNKAMFEALKSGRTNGNLDKAMRQYDEIEKELNAYLIDKASREQERIL